MHPKYRYLFLLGYFYFFIILRFWLFDGLLPFLGLFSDRLPHLYTLPFLNALFFALKKTDG